MFSDALRAQTAALRAWLGGGSCPHDALLNDKGSGNPPMKMDKGKYDAGGKLKNGIFKEHFKDGTLSCIGEYSNSEKVGEWKYYLRNGSLKAIGKYSNGKMTAEWKWYRENGEELMQTGSFYDEKKVGIWKRYHANGALYDEGEYVNDKKVGEWRTYGANGKLTKTARHKPR
jgi:antitoxin component YwqK of YwqJK toxin-antitoxin module